MPYSTSPNGLTHVLHTDDAQQYTFRYLQNPDSETWLRGGSPNAACPRGGDFVVLQLDPRASVSHLDPTARAAAKAIQPRKYVAFILQGYGIPLDTKPTNPHDILFVRRGIAPVRRPPFDTSEMCIPILPNTYHPRSRNPVRPAQPLRWPDCYLDTTFGFPVSCRVTTVSRDYTPVLPVNIPDLIKLRKYVREDKRVRIDLGDRLRGGSIDAIASIPLPASPTLSTASLPTAPAPLSDSSQPVERDREDASSDTESCSSSPSVAKSVASDVMSVIASVDSLDDEDVANERSQAESLDLDMMLLFQDFLNDTGDINDPVVHVWYDLDEISEVLEPGLFLEECAQVKRIVDEAKIRLGITPGVISSPAPSSRSPSAHSRELLDSAEDPTRPNARLEEQSSVRSKTTSLSTPTAVPRPRHSRTLRLLLAVPRKLHSLATNLGRHVSTIVPAPCHKQ